MRVAAEASSPHPSQRVESHQAVVRDLDGAVELRAAQALQRRAWGITEDGYTLPVATLAAAQKVGGLVLGAFDGQQRLLGFSFAFLGRVRGQLVLYSQLTAVEPGVQGGGVGRALKLAQRERARAMGLEAVVWAFDPLQAGNAWFNLVTLGATSRTYEVDLYGSRADALNAGLATDRLLAEWDTAAEREPRRALPGAADLVHVADGPRAAALPDDGRPARIPIPARVVDVAAADSDLAHRWQAAVREAFQAAFAAGYVATGFERGEQAAYLLERPA